MVVLEECAMILANYFLNVQPKASVYKESQARNELNHFDNFFPHLNWTFMIFEPGVQSTSLNFCLSYS